MVTREDIIIGLKMISDISDIKGNASQLQKIISKLKLPDKLQLDFTKTFGNLESEINKASNALSTGFKQNKDVTAFENSIKKISGLMMTVTGLFEKIGRQDLIQSFSFDKTQINEITQEISRLKQVLTSKLEANGLSEVVQRINELKNAKKGTETITAFYQALKNGNVNNAKQSLHKLESQVKSLKTKYENLKNVQGAEAASTQNAERAWKNSLQTYEIANKVFQQLQSVDLQSLLGQITSLSNKAENLEARQLEEFIDSFNQLKHTLPNVSNELRDYGNATIELGRQSVRAEQDVEHLKNQVIDFFSIGNTVEIFKRSIRSAFNTIQELDKTMTEAAVVTDFSVSEMWGQLPTYTANASKLGATINDLYAATTLYYQQGKNKSIFIKNVV